MTTIQTSNEMNVKYKIFHSSLFPLFLHFSALPSFLQISCGISPLDERRRPARLHHRLGGARHRRGRDDHRVPDQQVEAQGRHQERRRSEQRGVSNMHTTKVTDIFCTFFLGVEIFW